MRPNPNLPSQRLLALANAPENERDDRARWRWIAAASALSASALGRAAARRDLNDAGVNA